MNIIDIIEKKKISRELTKQEIEFFINGYTDGSIADYQAAALIMAICINGMTQNEILNLTLAMANSGETLDLSEISDNIVDKHSTGGVGDKITLILSPIIAALGVPVAKMSGRGLGITGGTADKLQSIPGYNTEISIDDFKRNVKDIGISLISQTLNLAPADKKIYALRDSIGCTNSIPLIASSIMSKKIAAGASNIVLDVTCGSGAFMKDRKEAEKLAKMMNLIGEWAHRTTISIITNMDEPLGHAVGNSLEVVESINFLKGDMPEDVKEVVFTMGSYMLKLAGKGNDLKQNREKIQAVIDSGEAFEKFRELVIRQGGDVSFIDNPEKFEKAPIIVPVVSRREGYVQSLNAEVVGKAGVELGVGRKKKEDSIDPRLGFIFVKKTGDYVDDNEVLAYVHAPDAERAEEAVNRILEAYDISSLKQIKKNNILEVLY
ncbi:MAG: thymidine phosphorylase [Clostridia bacterium]|nr:thymidine phosphorylase [Clostridia bacterium]